MLTFEHQADLSILISRLYGRANDVSLPDFQQFCFDNLSEQLGVGEGIWLTLRRDKESVLLSGAFGYNNALPKNRLQQISASVSSKDIVSLSKNYSSLIDQKTLDVTIKYLKSSNTFEKTSAASNIILNDDKAFWAVSHGNFVDVIGIDTSSSVQSLHPDQLSLCSLYLEHMIEAKRLNILSSFNRGWRHRNSSRAVCDVNGYLLHAEAPFIEVIQEQQLNEVQRQSLSKLKPGVASPLAPVNGMKIEATLQEGLIYLELIHEAVLPEQLSSRQKQVANALMKGLSDKQIADELNISKYTVSNHTKSIYKVLGVKNRTEAVSKLLEQNS